jgi:hypothetical protein
VWSFEPDPAVITGVPQFADVQPPDEMVTFPATILFKSNPLVVAALPLSGIPLLPFALSAMGILIINFPPTGTWLTVVKATVQDPDCEATA